MEKRQLIDPWGETAIEDYEKLFADFGIRPLKPLIPLIPSPPSFIRRGVIFGHRDLELILSAIKEKKDFAVMSGIKPTGDFHLGALLTAREIVYFQKLGGFGVYCIADIEAYEDNDIPYEESERIAVDNVADVLALGFDPKRGYIYRQSKETRVKDLAFLFGRGVTLATITAIYGERHMGLYMSALVQAGDIMLPQLPDFGGPKPTLVPVGVDQDPHIRFTRDLAQKFHAKYGFYTPSATYHRIVKGLDGSPKMSKRNPMGYFTLAEDLESIKAKLIQAFTGGRATVKEQRELGGEPERCPIYDLNMFYFMEDDDKVVELYINCKNGNLLCGDCKLRTAKVVLGFVKDHQRKRVQNLDKAREILGVN
ncbi:MAG: tryptophan--tRNA ligase [Candidatus Nezhaarchaeales archaeon]